MADQFNMKWHNVGRLGQTQQSSGPQRSSNSASLKPFCGIYVRLTTDSQQQKTSPGDRVPKLTSKTLKSGEMKENIHPHNKQMPSLTNLCILSKRQTSSEQHSSYRSSFDSLANIALQVVTVAECELRDAILPQKWDG